MTIKKKAASSDHKAIKTQSEGMMPAVGGRPAAGAIPDPPSAAKLQIMKFEEAVQLFAHRRFADAKQRFDEAMKGPAPHVSDKARSYSQVCGRKMTAVDLDLKTAEEFFNYGVERLNARDIQQARTQFARALDLEPDAEHIRYTMALACGLDGDAEGAYENLRRAIELEPRNRILARQDPDFSAIAQHNPNIRTLLRAEQISPF